MLLRFPVQLSVIPRSVDRLLADRRSRGSIRKSGGIYRNSKRKTPAQATEKKH